MKRKTKFDFKSEEERQAHLKAIIAFFHDERGEDIGFVAAEAVMEFIFTVFGDEIYTKAIRDAKTLVNEQLDSLETELDLLTDRKS
jgi:uncharacterized protein (DUF2164 family)